MLIFFDKLVKASVIGFRVLQRGKMTYHNLHSNFKWRIAKGLSENPNAYGPLTNLPDYTFLDGRPTPLGQNLRKRLVQQRQYMEKIVALTKEVDTAIENHAQKQQDIEDKNNMILNRKLKFKGKKEIE